MLRAIQILSLFILSQTLQSRYPISQMEKLRQRQVRNVSQVDSRLSHTANPESLSTANVLTVRTCIFLPSLMRISLIFLIRPYLEENKCFLNTMFSSVQFSRLVMSDSATPWIAARQASLSITNSRSSLRFTSIESLRLSFCPVICLLWMFSFLKFKSKTYL